jgi:16S rRNA (cytosine967-C5)-methyltransferase
MKRLHLEDNVTAEAADATVWHPKEPVRYILLDAPCSATGTIRRHPDVLYNKSPTDSAKLIDVQARLLDQAMTMLVSGGVLIYCTCSLQKSEGERQIEAFLARTPNMRRAPLTADEIGGLEECITPEGDIRILPQHYGIEGGMDGFYVARLKKT